MSKKITAAITAVGGYVPEDKLQILTWKKWWIPTMNGSEPEQVLKKEGY